MNIKIINLLVFALCLGLAPVGAQAEQQFLNYDGFLIPITPQSSSPGVTDPSYSPAGNTGYQNVNNGGFVDQYLSEPSGTVFLVWQSRDTTVGGVRQIHNQGTAKVKRTTGGISQIIDFSTVGLYEGPNPPYTESVYGAIRNQPDGVHTYEIVFCTPHVPNESCVPASLITQGNVAAPAIYPNVYVEGCGKPKVIVTTDYGDFTLFNDLGGTANNDPNEPQDLVHFLAYSNHFDVRGLIGTNNPGFDFEETTENTALYKVINEHYRTDFSELADSDPIGYLSPDDLRARVRQGLYRQLYANPDPIINSSSSLPAVFQDGVRLIISEVNNASSACPVHILVWGGITDVASAVHRLHPSKYNRMKVIAIGSSNRDFSIGGDSFAWNYMTSPNIQFPQANFIKIDYAFRGLTTPGSVNLYTSPMVTHKTVMDDIVGGESGNTKSLRGLLEKSRVFASWHNKRSGDYPASNATMASRPDLSNTNKDKSLRQGDSLTTWYMLALLPQSESPLSPTLSQAIIAAVNNDNATTFGADVKVILPQLLDNYRARMNAIY